jgi:DNA-binding transcriptional ArsR family regulator
MTDLHALPLELFQASAGQAAGQAAGLLRALSNEKRLMVLCQLGDRELSVGQLLPVVGLSQSALSQHLARLREEGLVDTRRDGTTIFYRIADPSVLKVIAVLAEIFCPPLSHNKD